MAVALAVSLAWQLGSIESPGPVADPQHLRYERALTLTATALPQACTTLEADIFAHAAGGSNDLRIFTATGAEVPFTERVNEPAPADRQAAQPYQITAAAPYLQATFVMPARPYTDVVLNLRAHDFIATATVWRGSGHDAESYLGSFVLYDLTHEGLGRSTTLHLQESSSERLRVTLQTLNGQPFTTATLGPAEVPPSREAQTLTTTVASSTSFTQRGTQTIATLPIPAHVPVERVRFALADGTDQSFLRKVTVTARPDSGTTNEHVEGEIAQVKLESVDDQRLTFDAVLGANLAGPATVEIAIDNGSNPPLPLQSVQLEMRQRTACFHTANQSAFRLMYGDAALHAPVYSAASFNDAAFSMAHLGPELPNPLYTPRATSRSYTDLIWIGVLAALAAISGFAMHNTKRQGRR